VVALPSSSIRNVCQEPLDGLLEGNVERGKLEVRSDQLHQLGVGGGLAILTIVFGFVLKDRCSGVLEVFDDRICELSDADFVLFVDGEDDWLDALVFAQLPDEELGEIARVYKLAQWRPVTQDLEWSAVLFLRGSTCV